MTDQHNKIVLQLCVEPDDDGYHAWCPELPGCHTCGDTCIEAQMNCCDAIHAYLKSVDKEPLIISTPNMVRFENDA